MNVTIRLAKKSDFSAYLNLMQKTYRESFVIDEFGLTEEMFAPKFFHTPTALKFFTNIMQVSTTQKCWLAFIEDKLIGSITITYHGSECVVGGFYVATEYQGMGIGKKLWNLAQKYAKGKDITLSVYTHNTKAIELYKKWGFIIDQDKGIHSGQWEGWPEGVVIKSLFMKRKA